MIAPITHRIIFVNRFMWLEIRFVSTSYEHDHAHISGEQSTGSAQKGR